MGRLGWALVVVAFVCTAARGWAQTDTPTPTDTPTITPTPSATCAGTRLAIPIARTLDDGYAQGNRVLYAPNSCSFTQMFTDIVLQRSKLSASSYQTATGFLGFDTSVLGPGAVIAEAKLFVETGMFGNADHRNIVGEWFTPAGAIDCSDWASTAGSNAFSLPVDNLHVVKDTVHLPLTSANTMINRGGYTWLRLGMSGNLPTGLNKVDLVSFDTFGGGGVDPTLEVCYQIVPTPTGTLVTATPTNTPTPIWIDHFGSGFADEGEAVATSDAAGNVLAGGYYGGNINFGGSCGAKTTTGTDAFIAKFNPQGVCQWVNHTGNPGTNITKSIATDLSGNVYATGQFNNSIDFGCGIMTSGVPSSADVFVVKLNPSGVCQWSHRFGSGGDDIGYGIAIDSLSNVLLAGSFTGNCSITGLFADRLFGSNSGSGLTSFIAKYDTNGVYQWWHAFSQAFPNNGPDEAFGVAVDSADNAYITGYHQGVEYFDNVNPVASNAMSQDIYIAKYNNAGVFQWVNAFGSTGQDQARGIAIDTLNKLTIVGQFAAAIDFGGGTRTPTGPLSGFLASYDSAGAWRWDRMLTGTGVDQANSVAVDTFNNDVVTTGSFHNSLNFGGGNATSNGLLDIFIARYQSDGSYLNAVTYGGPADDEGLSIATDLNRNSITTGYFQGTVNFGGLGPISSQGSVDIFILKLDPPLDPVPAPTPTPFNHIVSLDNQVVSVGSTFHEFATIDTASTLQQFSLSYTFDPTKVSLVSIAPPPFVNDCIFHSANPSSGVIVVGITCLIARSGGGAIIDTTFNATAPGVATMHWTSCVLGPGSQMCTEVDGGVSIVASTPTRTPTATPTISPAPTNTFTAAPTSVPFDVVIEPNATSTMATSTPTQTRTFTSTPTVTVTFTPTRTNTIGPAGTATNTWTPSRTPTRTFTIVPTSTPTRTLTSTPLPSPIARYDVVVESNSSPTFTRTVTSTPTATPTATGTLLTATPTLTPTITSTPAPTLTGTPFTPTPNAGPFDVVSEQNGTGPTPTVGPGTPTATMGPGTPTPPLPLVPFDVVVEANVPGPTATPNQCSAVFTPCLPSVPGQCPAGTNCAPCGG